MSPSGGKRVGAGRPAETGEVRRNRVIKFADKEWALVKEEARKLGISASEYVRQKVFENK